MGILVRTILLLLFSYVYSITRNLFLYVTRIRVLIIFLSRTISFRFSSLALTRPNKINFFKIFYRVWGNSSIRISINISFDFKNIYFNQLLGLGSLPTLS